MNKCIFSKVGKRSERSDHMRYKATAFGLLVRLLGLQLIRGNSDNIRMILARNPTHDFSLPVPMPIWGNSGKIPVVETKCRTCDIPSTGSTADSEKHGKSRVLLPSRGTNLRMLLIIKMPFHEEKGDSWEPIKMTTVLAQPHEKLIAIKC